VLALLLNPVLDRVLTLQLGPRYQLVELAFDTALPGATAQPLHGDFAETNPGVIEALAVNYTTREVTLDCAPLAFAPGTHRDIDRSGFLEGRCVPASEYERYAGAVKLSTPDLGDVSVRSPLMLHGGSEHRATGDRSVGIAGFVAGHIPALPDVGVVMTAGCYERFPIAYRRHLARCRVVDDDRLPDHAASRPLNCIADC
jgi:ectoine hydroxylase-related dioxygenase (phytanoyl-CoA dioxygenase family)